MSKVIKIKEGCVCFSSNLSKGQGATARPHSSVSQVLLLLFFFFKGDNFVFVSLLHKYSTCVVSRETQQPGLSHPQPLPNPFHTLLKYLVVMPLVHLCGQGKSCTWKDTGASLLRGQLPSLPLLLLPADFLMPAVKLADAKAKSGRSSPPAGETCRALSVLVPALPAGWGEQLKVLVIQDRLEAAYCFGSLSTHGQASCNSLVLCQQVTYGPCSGWFEVKNQGPDAERFKAPNSNPFHSSFPYISVLREP